jgi:hypothetical protein
MPPRAALPEGNRPGDRSGDRLTRRVVTDVCGTWRDAVIVRAQLLEAITVAGHGDDGHRRLAKTPDDGSAHLAGRSDDDDLRVNGCHRHGDPFIVRGGNSSP